MTELRHYIKKKKKKKRGFLSRETAEQRHLSAPNEDTAGSTAQVDTTHLMKH